MYRFSPVLERYPEGTRVHTRRERPPERETPSVPLIINGGVRWSRPRLSVLGVREIGSPGVSACTDPEGTVGMGLRQSNRVKMVSPGARGRLTVGRTSLIPDQRHSDDTVTESVLVRTSSSPLPLGSRPVRTTVDSYDRRLLPNERHRSPSDGLLSSHHSIHVHRVRAGDSPARSARGSTVETRAFTPRCSAGLKRR